MDFEHNNSPLLPFSEQ